MMVGVDEVTTTGGVGAGLADFAGRVCGSAGGFFCYVPAVMVWQHFFRCSATSGVSAWFVYVVRVGSAAGRVLGELGGTGGAGCGVRIGDGFVAARPVVRCAVGSARSC